MTKREMYDELIADGAKLKAINCVSEETLTRIYFERFGHNPCDIEEHEEPNTEKLSNGEDFHDNDRKIRTLRFSESGWCDELKRSYFAGIYRPGSLREYNILRSYASGEI